MHRSKKLFVFIVDTGLVAVAFALSFLLRFDFHPPYAMGDLFWQGLFVALTVKPLVFIATGFYRNLWRYASLQDAINIFKVVSIASAVTGSIFIFLHYFSTFPRSIIVLDWFLLLFMISASRLAWRFYREFFLILKNTKGRTTLIIGAGEAGSLLLKELRREPASPYRIIGFVDDDKLKQGMRLNGVPVLGTLGQLQGIIRKFRVEEVIIAIPSTSGKVIRSIVENCKMSGVRFRILPSIRDLMDCKISASQIKDVEIEDLLGREPVVLDEVGIGNYLTGRNVLVSGAAGSIGSEICRQVARFRPAKLILLDNAETPLFHFERELSARHPELALVPLIGDVGNRGKIESVFHEFLPDVVFHAAAYKHVPLMEYNPLEAVANNIGGTRVLADAADRFGVRDFVMISTDKAVNPTNVMGATKRVGEIYVQALSRNSSTRFTTVRFGNVLGSNGSVVPLFKEQIKAGGPVTVTDPNVVRYFMTIPEAVQLVLQAGCLGKGGEIFVLDMGDPVRIVDLAEELIRLSGFVPYEDIKINFTGLRPGEKLFEELLMAGEGVKPTTHEKIRVAAAVETDPAAVTAGLEELLWLTSEQGIPAVMKSLRRMVPEFKPQYRFNGETPPIFQLVRPDLYPKKDTAATPAKIFSIRGDR